MPEATGENSLARPVIGIIGNHYVLDDQYNVQATGTMNVNAVARVCNALPLIVPPNADVVDIGDLMNACTGFIFTGGRPNVHPKHYGDVLSRRRGINEQCSAVRSRTRQQ